MSREWFVIRIYRRCADNPENICGLVEEVGTDRQRAFGSFGDLRQILLAAGQKQKNERRQQK